MKKSSHTLPIMFWLMGILLLAGMTRLLFLGSSPASLYWEEVALGYDAYSLAHTGKDIHGEAWPMVAITSFGDYKPSGYYYALIPFVGFFGLSEIAVRLPSALAGIGPVLVMYAIGSRLFNQRVGLWTSFLLAITPWHIHFSRGAFEVNLATFFLSLMLLFLLKAGAHKKYLVLAVLFGLLSSYTYHGMRVLAPLLFGFVMLVQITYYSRRQFVIGIVLFSIGLAPLLLNLSQPRISQRFNETSLFSTSSAVVRVNEWRVEDGNDLLSRIWHHRYWSWSEDIVVGMMRHFDLSFLFLRGDDNPRHQSDFVGLMYWWCLPLMLYGLSRLNRKQLLLIIGFALLASIPPSLTNATPHTLRFLSAVIPLVMLSAVGVARLVGEKHMAGGAMVILMLLSVTIYGYDYIGKYTRESGNDWQYGYEEMIEFVEQRRKDYDTIYITRALGRPSMYYWFYSKTDPLLVQRAAKTSKKDQGEFLEFENIVFGTPLESNELSNALVISTESRDTGEQLATITGLENTPVFYIYAY